MANKESSVNPAAKLAEHRAAIARLEGEIEDRQRRLRDYARVHLIVSPHVTGPAVDPGPAQRKAELTGELAALERERHGEVAAAARLELAHADDPMEAALIARIAETALEAERARDAARQAAERAQAAVMEQKARRERVALLEGRAAAAEAEAALWAQTAARAERDLQSAAAVAKHNQYLQALAAQGGD
jgi:hypothetical protein